jgi:Flp pilus assembly pilin Flp
VERGARPRYIKRVGFISFVGHASGGADAKGRNYMTLTYVRARLAREEGQALVEYALILSLIALAAIVGLGVLSNGINGIFSAMASNL